MSAHTPWMAMTQRVRDRVSGFEVCTPMQTDQDNHPLLIAIATTEANAKRIVTAVNAHDELVAALQGAIDRCESGTGGYVGQDGQFIKVMRAAIAKAEGKP